MSAQTSPVSVVCKSTKMHVPLGLMEILKEELASLKQCHDEVDLNPGVVRTLKMRILINLKLLTRMLKNRYLSPKLRTCYPLCVTEQHHSA